MGRMQKLVVAANRSRCQRHQVGHCEERQQLQAGPGQELPQPGCPPKSLQGLTLSPAAPSGQGATSSAEAGA